MSIKCVLSTEISQEVYPMAPDDFLASIFRKLKEDNNSEVTAKVTTDESFFRCSPGSIAAGNLIVANINYHWHYCVVSRVWNTDQHSQLFDSFEVYPIDGFPGPLSWEPKSKKNLLEGLTSRVTFLPATPTVIMVLSSYENKAALLHKALSEEKKKISTIVAALNLNGENH